MKIMSEKTGKEYKSVEECLAAEKEYDKALAEKKAAEEKALAVAKQQKEVAIAERKAFAEKVEDKRQALIKAQQEYRDELAAFCNKYGAYHVTLKPGDKSIFELFDHLFDGFWI